MSPERQALPTRTATFVHKRGGKGKEVSVQMRLAASPSNRYQSPPLLAKPALRTRGIAQPDWTVNRGRRLNSAPTLGWVSPVSTIANTGPKEQKHVYTYAYPRSRAQAQARTRAQTISSTRKKKIRAQAQSTDASTNHLLIHTEKKQDKFQKLPQNTDMPVSYNSSVWTKNKKRHPKTNCFKTRPYAHKNKNPPFIVWAHQRPRSPRTSEHELVHGSARATPHLLVQQQRTHVEEVQRVLLLPHPARRLERPGLLRTAAKRRRGGATKKTIVYAHGTAMWAGGVRFPTVLFYAANGHSM